MAAMKKSKGVELFWKVHPWIYRASKGRVLGHLANMDVLLLTTTGARSGLERNTALTYFQPSAEAVGGAGRYVVIGSFLGEPRDPGWVHNLRAKPEATLQVGAEVFAASAREARGDERERIWRELVAIAPDYRAYEGRTGREIPVVVLERAST